MTPRLSISLSIALLLSITAQADDWPEFRGPTGQGRLLKGSLPTEWGPDKNVVWKQAIPGHGWSSPVIVNGRIYLTSAVPAGKGAAAERKLEALCLDAGSGKVLWEVEVFRQGADAPNIHNKNSHASPTPLVHDGRLYVHFGHQGTACLDLSGKVLWKNDSLKYRPVHGNGGTPIVVDDKLVFSIDSGDEGFVVALDRSTGKVVWKAPRNVETNRKFSFSTPLLITVAGKKQVISPGSNVVVALDPDTGKEIWRVRYDGYSVIPRPVFGHGMVYVCTGYNSPSLLAIKPDGTGDVTDTHVVWKTNKFVPHTPSLLLDGDELYMVSDRGNVSCLDAKTGEVVWSERYAGSNFSASPILADGKIYLLSEEGVGTVLRLAASMFSWPAIRCRRGRWPRTRPSTGHCSCARRRTSIALGASNEPPGFACAVWPAG